MDKLKNILEKLIELTSDEWSIFNQKLNMKEFKAKTTVIREGNIAADVYFIKSGLLRTYHLQDGKEINTYFACDGQFISVFGSFITQTPSVEYLEAIEDSIVYSFSFEMLSELYKESPKFEKLGRIVSTPPTPYLAYQIFIDQMR
jgi:CRP-like cAMP-binding protein